MRKDRKSVTLLGLLQAGAALTIALSFLTALDVALFGVELFSPFRMQYLLASTLLLAIFAALRKPAYAVVLLATTAFNASMVVPWYIGEPDADNGAQLRIINVNVLADNDEYQRLIDLVSAEQPDVIFLQEYSHAWASALQPLKIDYPFSYAEPRYDSFGIAVYSRIPLAAVTHVDSPPSGYPTLVASLAIEGVPLTLISAHPTVPVTRSLYTARNQQLEDLAELINTAEGNVVFCGDLNATVWDHSYKRLEARTGLRNARRGFGLLPTWPTFMPFAMIPIDHLLVSEGVQVVDARTAGHIGSDHLPLLVTIAL